MKTAFQEDNDFIVEQEKLHGAKCVEETFVYKRYPGLITDIPDGGNSILLEGDATDVFSANNWFIVTTQKFSLKYRVTSAPSYASGETTIPSTGHGLSETDEGGYVALRYDLKRQVIKIGTITQAFEGPTLNQFATSASTIEMNDRAYTNLYDEANETGVFYQKGYDGTITSVANGAGTSTITVSVTGLTTNILRGYYFQLLSGYYEAQRLPIVSNTGNTITVWTGVGSELSNAVSGDEWIAKIENIFYLEILAGFKGAL